MKSSDADGWIWRMWETNKERKSRERQTQLVKLSLLMGKQAGTIDCRGRDIAACR